MRARAGLVAAALSLCALPAASSVGETYLTVSAPRAGRVRLTLPDGVRLAWSKATVAGGGTYRAAVLDQAVSDRAAGTVTSMLAVSALSATPLRSGRADSAAYPAGTYDVYLAADAPVTLRVPMTGTKPRAYRATLPLAAAKAAADTTPTAAVPPYDSSAAASFTAGKAFGIAFARWDVARLPGPYSTSAGLCFAAPGAGCAGGETAGSGVSAELPGKAAVEARRWVLPGAYGVTGAARAVTTYSGTWRPDRARLLMVTIPLAPGPLPAPVVAAVLTHSDSATIVAGRLGGPLKTVYRGHYSAHCVAVSPDGRKIAFSVENGGGTRAAVIGADGSGLRYLTPARGAGAPCNFVWTRDGRRLYYSDLANTWQAIFTVPVDGSRAPTLVKNGAHAVASSLRRDGKVLAFTEENSASRYGRTAVVGVDGSGRRHVGGDNLTRPLWSPDSRSFAAMRMLKVDFENGSTVQAQIVDVATGRHRALAATQRAGVPGTAMPVAWSADSRHVYYVHFNVRNGGWQDVRLRRIGADGAGNTDLTPAWGAGTVAFVSVQQQ